MSAGGGSEPHSSPPPRKVRLRRLQRLSRRYGLALEVFLVVSLLLALRWESPFAIFLALAALGLLISLDTVLPLIRAEADGLAVDRDRLSALPYVSLLGQGIKLCSGVFALVVGTVGLPSVGILYVDTELLSVPGQLDNIAFVSAVLAFVTVPWVTATLLVCVFVHVLVRSLRFTYEAI